MGMTIKEIQKGGAMNVPAAAQRQGFARALAVCYNTQTGTLTCGMSGKLRKVRIHPLIWGKSVEVLYGYARSDALAVVGVGIRDLAWRPSCTTATCVLS
jgi:hypothetical protein